MSHTLDDHSKVICVGIENLRVLNTNTEKKLALASGTTAHDGHKDIGRQSRSQAESCKAKRAGSSMDQYRLSTSNSSDIDKTMICTDTMTERNFGRPFRDKPAVNVGIALNSASSDKANDAITSHKPRDVAPRASNTAANLSAKV
ncbi:hypothetical protein HG531_012847 [Fusarium graminearum]|nr:hypothetical protein HG531_012847 [Fusarium graminearum]